MTYTPFGNEEGIEPLVIHRGFHGMRDSFVELSQEFRLYHNLWPEPGKKRFMLIDGNGDESEVARYGEDFLEIRTDLVLKFCAVKQLALAIYVDITAAVDELTRDLLLPRLVSGQVVLS